MRHPGKTGSKRSKRIIKIFKPKKITKRKRVPRKVRPISITLKEHLTNKKLMAQSKRDVIMTE